MSEAAKAREADEVGAARQRRERQHALSGDRTSRSTDSTRVYLKEIGNKYHPGELAAFLRKPSAHYADTRMPDFALTEGESTDLTYSLSEDAKEVSIKIYDEAGDLVNTLEFGNQKSKKR